MTETKTDVQLKSGADVTIDSLTSEGEAILQQRVHVRDEWARAKETEGVVCQTHVGGQALIEGIMMRGKYNWAVAVREPDGNIYIEEHDLVSGRDKNSWLHKPVVRGCTAMVESLALGYKALDIASQHAFDLSEEEDEVESEKKDRLDEGDNSVPEQLQAAVAEEPSSENQKEIESTATIEKTGVDKNDAEQEDEGYSLPKGVITAAMIMGLVLGIVLFVVLPAFLTNFLVGDYGEKTLLWNIIDGIIRIAIFIFYIWLIGRMNDIKRMFAYHGAEHKTIHCYEHGLDLTVENARKFPTLHVRCGTAFMLMTMLIAILVFTITPIAPLIDLMGVTNEALRLVLVIISRIILLPIVAGLSYEITVKWAGSRPKSPLVQFVLWPGMQMQRLTTNPPDDEMLECAIAAVKRVLEREQLEHAKQQVKTEGTAPAIP